VQRESGTAALYAGPAPVRRLLTVSIVSLCLLAPGPPRETSGSSVGNGTGLVLDLLVLRPLGAASTAVGFGLFLIAGPFAAPSGQFGDAWEIFVKNPYAFTFERPLGDLDDL